MFNFLRRNMDSYLTSTYLYSPLLGEISTRPTTPPYLEQAPAPTPSTLGSCSTFKTIVNGGGTLGELGVLLFAALGPEGPFIKGASIATTALDLFAQAYSFRVSRDQGSESEVLKREASEVGVSTSVSWEEIPRAEKYRVGRETCVAAARLAVTTVVAGLSGGGAIGALSAVAAAGGHVGSAHNSLEQARMNEVRRRIDEQRILHRMEEGVREVTVQQEESERPKKELEGRDDQIAQLQTTVTSLATELDRAKQENERLKSELAALTKHRTTEPSSEQVSPEYEVISMPPVCREDSE